ncbi:MAG: helix-turn-helix domain-containing protein [Alphaproteobacteria bacterium]|nr:helix-turn-helix domain-containing protein [Alphaproteobacteria bacterium]
MSIRSSTVAVAATPRLAISVAEATDALGIGRAHAYVLMQRGTLPYVRVGRRRLLRVADLVAFVAALPTSPEASA